MNIQENKSEFEQVKDTIFLWLKHWYYFVISMAICLIIAFVYLKVKTPVMAVAAQVSLRHDESLTGSSSLSKNQSLLSAFGFGGGSQNIEDESLKMGSQGYLKKMVRKFALNFDYTQTSFLGLVKKKLYDQSPVVLSVDEAVSDTIPAPVFFTLNVKKDQTTVSMKYLKKVIGKYEVTTFPSVLETPLGAFTISKSEYFDKYEKPMKIKVLYTNFDFMTQIYKDAILIDFLKKNSDLITLTMNTENVVQAKKILSEIIGIYNAEWEFDKDLVTNKTLAFINDRLNLVDGELLNADKAIQNFKDRYKLTDIEADVKYNLTLSGELQPKLLEAESQSKIMDLIADFVKDEKNKYSLFPLAPNMAIPAMAEIIGKYNEALAKRNEMYQNNSQSPWVKDYDSQVELQRETLLKTVDNFKKSLQIVAKNLKNKDSEIKSKIGEIPTIEKDYLGLKREQELQQTIYIFLLEMREQTGVKGVSLLPKLKVIDAPYVINKPVEPSMVKVAITTLFFGGILLPLFAIYGLPLVNNYIRKRKMRI